MGNNTQPRTTKRRVNGLGQLVEIIDPANNKTQYNYSPYGQLHQKIDALGNVVTIDYDAFGNRVEMNDPDMGQWSFRYNAFAELVWQKDAKQQTTSLSYDFLGRLKSRNNTEGTSNWSYNDQEATHKVWLGKLTEVTAASGFNETYAYDTNYGRLVTTNTEIDAGGIKKTYTLKQTYDDFGRIETLTYPNTILTLKHEYQNGRLKRLVNNDDATDVFWQVNAMNENDQATSVSYGNGIFSSYTYSIGISLVETIKTGPSSNSTGIQNLKYQYNNLYNLTSRTDNNRTLTESFTYDALDRLKTVTGPSDKSYQYDAIGNIKYKSDVGYYYYNSSRPHAVTDIEGINRYGSITAGDANGDGIIDGRDVNALVTEILNPGSAKGQADCNNNATITTTDVICVYNKLTNVSGDRTISYDANGNIRQDGNKSIEYTSFNKPSKIFTDTKTVSYSYDADNNRVSQVNGSHVIHYIGKLYEYERLADQSVKQRLYLYAGGAAVATLVKSGTTTSRYYLHTDLLGSVESMTDNTGTSVEQMSFDAFGKRRISSTWLDGSPVVNDLTRRGYTGHEMDDEFGYINMNARIYDPGLGRFLTADTVVPDVENPMAWDRYGYVLNNPFRYTDPTGHEYTGPGLVCDGCYASGNDQGYYVNYGGDFAFASTDVGGSSSVVADNCVGECSGSSLYNFTVSMVFGTSSYRDLFDECPGGCGFQPKGIESIGFGVDVVAGLGSLARGGFKAFRGRTNDVVPNKLLVSTQQADQLRLLANTEFESLMALKQAKGITNSEMGPALSVAMDLKTGKISQIHRNNQQGFMPENMSPQLVDRLNIAPDDVLAFERTHGIGSHAEIYAVDELFKARSNATFSDFAVHTIELQNSKYLGGYKPACTHCNFLLDDVQYVK